MAIDSFDNLKTAVANWLDRNDLADRIPEFITLAENRINRHVRIRAMERRSTAPTKSGEDYMGLPSGYIQMRHISVSQNGRDLDLEYMSPERFDVEMTTKWGGGSGRPRIYTLVGDEIRLGPTPDAVYTIEMVYYKKFDHLSTTQTSNWLITDAPDLLLYGALLEAEPFVKDQEAAKMWGMYFSQAVEAITTADAKDRWSGGALHVTSDQRGI
jgi:hypothetical protein